MIIDGIIERHRATKGTAKSGGNKKVRVFDDYVLLAGGFKEDEIQQLIKITNELKERGVAVVPTLEYKIVYPPNELGYARGYMLQPRAAGTEIYDSNMSDADYHKRLHDIANMDSQKIDKFVSDWIAIEKAGLMVDPSKVSNFFYSDAGISFIDLSVANRPQPLENYFRYACGVLANWFEKFSTPSEINDTLQIIKNVAVCFVRHGLGISEIINVLSRRNSLSKAQIYSIADSLTKEKQNGATTEHIVVNHGLNSPTLTM